ncbi:hypothetical protein [Synechococcus phage S-N03]|uniref:Uncharacterized protein n=1 Tax=Synechococcus phage S-N03 TaxID=2718943 RepID=A0A6G8R5H8_9CAUD|nr:hypothetical protein PQC09_gp024 [Synechococcus phage S-N03]QIN96659.1 hypothetical protein [Synechococcus phage S-N03]
MTKLFDAYVQWWVDRIGARNVYLLVIVKYFGLGILLGLML